MIIGHFISSLIYILLKVRIYQQDTRSEKTKPDENKETGRTCDCYGFRVVSTTLKNEHDVKLLIYNEGLVGKCT